MRRLLLILSVVVFAPCVWGENYTYLTFETVEGSKVSVDASELSITFDGNTLKAGGQSFLLTNLSKMYFSQTDETLTGVGRVWADEVSGASAVFDLNGRAVTGGVLSNGVYVIKDKSGNCKLVVR